MAGGVNIPIAADASGVVSEGKKIEVALDQVVDSLDDIETTSKHSAQAAEESLFGIGGKALRTSDQVTNALDDVGTSAKRNANDLEDKFSQAFDTVKAQAKATGDAVDRETHAGTGKAGESVKEFKGEALQNLSEVASSFQGDITSAADLVQGTFGGLATMGGPIGLAAAAIAGLAGLAFKGWQEQAAETKQTVEDMFADMTTSGQDYLSEAIIQQGVKDTVLDPKLWDQVKVAAEAAGVSQSTALRAVNGDMEAQRQMAAGLAEAKANLADKEVALTQDVGYGNEKYDQRAVKNAQEAKDLEVAQGLLDNSRDKLERASAAAGAYAQAAEDASSRSVAAAQAIDQGYDNIRGTVTTKVVLDDSQARQALDAFIRNRQVRVDVLVNRGEGMAGGLRY